MEDIYVRPEYRGKGLGRSAFKFLGKLAADRNCGTLEFTVLDWNKPAIEFYESLGAKHREKWMIFRITGEDLKRLAKDD